MRTQDGIDFLGYRIFPTHRLLRQTAARRFIRRLRLQSKLYARNLLSLQCIDPSVQSWLGHATHAATYGLRRSVFSAIAFRRMPVPSAGSAGEGQAVLRGGGWNNNALNVRVPNRNRNAPANRNDNIGIRCA